MPVGTEPRLRVLYPESQGWERARRAWNLAVDRQPEAVAFPESVAEVVASIDLARSRGWRIALQGTGHGASAMGSLEDTVLLKTERMRGVAVEPEARVARAEAGARWQNVVLARARPGNGALASLDAAYAMYAVGVAPTPELAAAAGEHASALLEARSPPGPRARRISTTARPGAARRCSGARTPPPASGASRRRSIPRT